MSDWLRWSSWASCPTCGIYHPMKLIQASFRQTNHSGQQVSISCPSCAGRRRNTLQVLQPQDVPEPLRNLSSAQVFALRPLQLSQGEPKQHHHGYKRRERLSALSWHTSSVRDRVSALPRQELLGAQLALDCLLAMTNSPYRAWIQSHDDVLRKLAEVTDEEERQSILRLSFSTLLEPFVESALWPHLYFRKNLCESVQYAGSNWKPLQKNVQRRDNLTRSSLKVRD